jgi:hypothetical protein
MDENRALEPLWGFSTSLSSFGIFRVAVLRRTKVRIQVRYPGDFIRTIDVEDLRRMNLWPTYAEAREAMIQECARSSDEFQEAADRAKQELDLAEEQYQAARDLPEQYVETKPNL